MSKKLIEKPGIHQKSIIYNNTGELYIGAPAVSSEASQSSSQKMNRKVLILTKKEFEQNASQLMSLIKNAKVGINFSTTAANAASNSKNESGDSPLKEPVSVATRSLEKIDLKSTFIKSKKFPLQNLPREEEPVENTKGKEAMEIETISLYSDDPPPKESKGNSGQDISFVSREADEAKSFKSGDDDKSSSNLSDVDFDADSDIEMVADSDLESISDISGSDADLSDSVSNDKLSKKTKEDEGTVLDNESLEKKPASSVENQAKADQSDVFELRNVGGSDVASIRKDYVHDKPYVVLEDPSGSLTTCFLQDGEELPQNSKDRSLPIEVLGARLKENSAVGSVAVDRSTAGMLPQLPPTVPPRPNFYSSNQADSEKRYKHKLDNMSIHLKNKSKLIKSMRQKLRRMTSRLKKSQGELTAATEQLDKVRRETLMWNNANMSDLAKLIFNLHSNKYRKYIMPPEVKSFVLSLYLTAPKAYHIVRNCFNGLPHHKTVTRWINTDKLTSEAFKSKAFPSEDLRGTLSNGEPDTLNMGEALDDTFSRVIDVALEDKSLNSVKNSNKSDKIAFNDRSMELDQILPDEGIVHDSEITHCQGIIPDRESVQDEAIFHQHTDQNVKVDPNPEMNDYQEMDEEREMDDDRGIIPREVIVTDGLGDMNSDDDMEFSGPMYLVLDEQDNIIGHLSDTNAEVVFCPETIIKTDGGFDTSELPQHEIVISES